MIRTDELALAREPFSLRGFMGVGIQRLNSMQRIRIGLTGLAFVFLLVLLGTAISRNSTEPPANAAENADAPNEPLAELGVAPGQDDGNETNAQGNSSQ